MSPTERTRENADEYTNLRNQLKAESDANAGGAPQWQQFVVHLIDERGDGIDDYFIELYTMHGNELRPLQDFDLDPHAYTEDTSYRCFHVNLTNLSPGGLSNLWLRLIAKSGTQLVAYHGFGSERATPEGVPAASNGLWDAIIDISSNLPNGANDPKFFYPFTTTLVEILMNREPMPLELSQVSNLFKFLRF